MSKLDEFLRITEAAEYLGVCPNTLRNWGRAGKITEYRHPANNYRLFKQAELDAMLTEAGNPVAMPRQAASETPGKTKPQKRRVRKAR